MNKNDIDHEITCQYCGNIADFVDSAVVYGGKSFGMIYLCKCKPPHFSYVGVHKKTQQPLGTLADYSTRKARARAHEYFDRLWKSSKAKMDRTQAYHWLSDQLGIDPQDTHIGLFDAETCYRTISLCKQYWDHLHQLQIKR